MSMSAFNSARTTFPMLKMPIAEFAHDKEPTRDIVMIVDEEIVNECAEPRQMVWFVDVTIEIDPDGDFELHGQGSGRQFLSAGRAIWRAFFQ